MNTSKVTRLEVIDHRKPMKGRVFTEWDKNMSVELSVQDDGRTLKIFIVDRKPEE